MAYLIRCSVMAACLSVSCGVVADEVVWPQFRGPNGAGIAHETGLPVDFGPHQNLLWKVALPEGHSSPVIWNDQIFLTGFESGLLQTICIDRRTGQLRWRKTTGERAGLRKGHPTNSRASPTPATDGERVYVYFGPLGLFAYDLDGNEEWHVPVPKVKQPWGVGTSPVLAGDKVLLCVDYDIDSFLLAVDASSGKQLWKTERPDSRRGFSTPLVLQEHGQVVVAGSLRIAGYDLQSGREVWTVKGLPYQVSPSPVFADGMIYIAAWDAAAFLESFDTYLKYDSNQDEKISFKEYKFAWEHSKYDRDKDGFVTRQEFDSFVRFSGNSHPALLAIKPGGKGDVTSTHVKWESTKSLPHISTVLVYRSLVYTIRGGGIVTCYDAKSGKIHYRARIPARGAYYASPVASDGRVYFASKSGEVVVVKAGPKLDVLATNQFSEPIFATPAIVDGKIFLRTARHLYAFSDRSAEDTRLISELNRYRDSLADRLLHDFGKDSNLKERFRAYRIPDPIEQTENGIRVVAAGAEGWNAAQLNLRHAIRGDFDITARFAVERLETPADKGSSGVNLRVVVGKDKPTAHLLSIRIYPDGDRRVIATLGTGNGRKWSWQTTAQTGIQMVDQMRLVRRDETLYFLYSDTDSKDVILERQRVGRDDVPLGELRLYVQTHGVGRKTTVLWNSLEICAEEIVTNRAAETGR